MPPWSEDPEHVPPLFPPTGRIWPANTIFPKLSMGMSGDLETAIEEGATIDTSGHRLVRQQAQTAVRMTRRPHPVLRIGPGLPVRSSLFRANRASKSSATDLRDLLVPMRDGIRLATDVFLPLRVRPLAHGARSHALQPPRPSIRGYHYFVQRGYALVVQDLRGRWASQGTFGRHFARRRPMATTPSTGSPRNPGPTAASPWPAVLILASCNGGPPLKTILICAPSRRCFPATTNIPTATIPQAALFNSATVCFGSPKIFRPSPASHYPPILYQPPAASYRRCGRHAENPDALATRARSSFLRSLLAAAKLAQRSQSPQRSGLILRRLV